MKQYTAFCGRTWYSYLPPLTKFLQIFVSKKFLPLKPTFVLIQSHLSSLYLLNQQRRNSLFRILKANMRKSLCLVKRNISRYFFIPHLKSLQLHCQAVPARSIDNMTRAPISNEIFESISLKPHILKSERYFALFDPSTPKNNGTMV